MEFVASQSRAILTLGDQPLFTTAEMLSVQAKIIDRFRAGRSTRTALVAAASLDEALVVHKHLTAEQRDLVASCTSGHRAQYAIGRAGAGKTTAMRAAVAAWTVAGYRVLGTAVKGEAARHLANEAGIHFETLAWHLVHTDPHTSPLDGRTVLIVDEASTVSDRDLDRLLWLCDETGAAVRLVGDPAQHGAVRAGGMFRVLCQAAMTHPSSARLTASFTRTTAPRPMLYARGASGMPLPPLRRPGTSTSSPTRSTSTSPCSIGGGGPGGREAGTRWSTDETTPASSSTVSPTDCSK